MIFTLVEIWVNDSRKRLLASKPHSLHAMATTSISRTMGTDNFAIAMSLARQYLTKRSGSGKQSPESMKYPSYKHRYPSGARQDICLTSGQETPSDRTYDTPIALSSASRGPFVTSPRGATTFISPSFLPPNRQLHAPP